MRIQVTQTHINCGRRNSCSRCPVALAFVDAGFLYVDVMHTEARLDTGIVDLPVSVSRRLAKFDTGGDMEPFEFDITEPAA